MNADCVLVAIQQSEEVGVCKVAGLLFLPRKLNVHLQQMRVNSMYTYNRSESTQ